MCIRDSPYANCAEYRPGTASMTTDIETYKWTDGQWMEKRSQSDPVTGPMSIYEVHLGSWRKKNRPEKDGYYTYVEAAHELAAYVKEMGYTHVELMGICLLYTSTTASRLRRCCRSKARSPGLSLQTRRRPTGLTGWPLEVKP